MKSQNEVIDMINKQAEFYGNILSISKQENQEVIDKLLKIYEKKNNLDVNEMMRFISKEYSLVARKRIEDNSFDFVVKYLKDTKGKKTIKTLEELLNLLEIDLTLDMALFLIENHPELQKYLEEFDSDVDYEKNDVIATLYDVYCDYKNIGNKFSILNDPKSEYKNIEGYYSDDSFTMYIHEIAKYPLLTPSEEIELFKKYKDQNDVNARQKILNSNLRLVVSVVKKYYSARVGSNSFTLIDLVQEGNIGLMKAVEKFDYTKGFKFSTYAIWWIKQSITRALLDKADIVRLPVHAGEIYKKLRTYMAENNTMPTVEEVAKEYNISEKLAKELLFFTSNISTLTSLNTPIGDSDDSTIEDFVENDDVSIEDQIETTILSEEVSKLLSKLTPREKLIIEKRYGIGYPKTYTLGELGEELGLTRERVRQIQKSAMKKLNSIAKAKSFPSKYLFVNRNKAKDNKTKTNKATSFASTKYIPKEIRMLATLKNESNDAYAFIWSNLSSEERELIKEKFGENLVRYRTLDGEKEKLLFGTILEKIEILYQRFKYNANSFDEAFENHRYSNSVINYYKLSDAQKDILAKCYGPYLTDRMNPDILPEDEKKLYPIFKQLYRATGNQDGYLEYEKLVNGEFEKIPTNYINLLINLFKNKDILALASDEENEEVSKAFDFILRTILTEEEYLIVMSYFGIGKERLSFDDLSYRIGINSVEIQKRFLNAARKLISSPHLNVIRKKIWEKSHDVLIDKDSFDFYSFFPNNCIKYIPQALTKLDLADIAIIRRIFPNGFNNKVNKDDISKEDMALFYNAIRNLKVIIDRLNSLIPERNILDDSLYEILRLCETKFVTSDYQKIVSYLDETEQKVLLYCLSRESVTDQGIEFAAVKIGKPIEKTIEILKTALNKIAAHISEMDLNLSDIEREYLFSTIKRS